MGHKNSEMLLPDLKSGTGLEPGMAFLSGNVLDWLHHSTCGTGSKGHYTPRVISFQTSNHIKKNSTNIFTKLPYVLFMLLAP
ncbi:MAG: hypothetical protein OXM00_00810 [Paracoccaceae bacterium]|nr:hypothetical protein [Paracoccaceae bacterium]